MGANGWLIGMAVLEALVIVAFATRRTPAARPPTNADADNMERYARDLCGMRVYGNGSLAELCALLRIGAHNTRTRSAPGQGERGVG